MKISRIYLSELNKWQLNIEGINKKGKPYTTTIAIPPTNGDRVDIILEKDMEAGYRSGESCIVIDIIKGQPKIKLYG